MKSLFLLQSVFTLATALFLLNIVSPETVRGAEASSKAGSMLVYFGTYTGGKSKGIYVSQLDLASGKLSAPELAGEAKSPSFLAIHPNHRFLYAVSEIENFGGKPSGGVASFSIDAKSGKLTPLNQQTSGGPGPCHLSVDKTGKYVLVANYSGGSIEALPIQSDGQLGAPTAFIQHTGSSVIKERQENPHAHSINLDAANRFAIVGDLGLDKVFVYRFDSTKGTLVPNDPASVSVKAGSGPRHFAFHPSGRYGYVINEIQCTITAFNYDSDHGTLKELQTISTLPGAVERGFSTAEVQVHPSGKFLYGSNRGHDTIAVYSIEEKTGRLTFVERESTKGKVPRNFGIDPTGKFLLAANQDSDSVAVFRIDSKSGALDPTGQIVEVGKPVCVKFLAR